MLIFFLAAPVPGPALLAHHPSGCHPRRGRCQLPRRVNSGHTQPAASRAGFWGGGFLTAGHWPHAPRAHRTDPSIGNTTGCHHHQSLLPTALGQMLGQLLSADFAPLPRFTEQLAQASAIDAATDDALIQVVDALLPTLPAEPLRQTSKLLSSYVDLRTRYSPAAPIPAVE